MSDFWKIVGRHSKHWNYPKKETIELLQTYIDQQVTKGKLELVEHLLTSNPIYTHAAAEDIYAELQQQLKEQSHADQQ